MKDVKDSGTAETLVVEPFVKDVKDVKDKLKLKVFESDEERETTKSTKSSNNPSQPPQITANLTETGIQPSQRTSTTLHNPSQTSRTVGMIHQPTLSDLKPSNASNRPVVRRETTNTKLTDTRFRVGSVVRIRPTNPEYDLGDLAPTFTIKRGPSKSNRGRYKLEWNGREMDGLFDEHSLSLVA